MGIQQLFQSLIERLQSSASVKNVYGEPIKAEGKTLIPIASIRYGFGGGVGTQKEEGETDGKAGKEGVGGGGGVVAVPAGVLEVTQDHTLFIPFYDRRKMLGMILIGMMVGMVMGGHRAKKNIRRSIKMKEEKALTR